MVKEENVKKYINDQQKALQYSILFTTFPTTYFGRYSVHLHGDVIARIQLLLIVPLLIVPLLIMPLLIVPLLLVPLLIVPLLIVLMSVYKN